VSKSESKEEEEKILKSRIGVACNLDPQEETTLKLTNCQLPTDIRKSQRV
jgi:hypothetical protein